MMCPNPENPGRKTKQKARSPWPLPNYLEDDDVPKPRNTWYLKKKKKTP